MYEMVEQALVKVVRYGRTPALSGAEMWSSSMLNL